jgi:hypothetical protein
MIASPEVAEYLPAELTMNVLLSWLCHRFRKLRDTLVMLMLYPLRHGIRHSALRGCTWREGKEPALKTWISSPSPPQSRLDVTFGYTHAVQPGRCAIAARSSEQLGRFA